MEDSKYPSNGQPPQARRHESALSLSKPPDKGQPTYHISREKFDGIAAVCRSAFKSVVL